MRGETFTQVSPSNRLKTTRNQTLKRSYIVAFKDRREEVRKDEAFTLFRAANWDDESMTTSPLFLT